ncbi:MAG: ferritin-like domain-containing protein [Deltaproteobacteria bacterium]|nr:ferritin-like domain-containing protein [Deltaproteobacteria bacterium]
MATLEEIVTPLKTIWRFDYDSNVKALRDLYELAKKEQWNAATDVPWELETDPAQVGTLDMAGEDPILGMDFIKELPEDKRVDLAKRRSAWQLSQFLHGEQGAMLCAGQLVETVPDMDGKFYASTQVIDEARHVEVFHRYVERLDRVYPIMPNLKALLNAVLGAELWQMKCVGMQVIAESLAMGSFKMMKKGTNDELLRQIVELTAQDEARHVSYGLIYMKEELPKMAEDERNAVEDFALAGVGLLAGPDNEAALGAPLLQMMGEVGIDVEVAVAEMATKLATPEARAARFNPFQEYVVPQLKRIDLITERTAPGYRAMGLEV